MVIFFKLPLTRDVVQMNWCNWWIAANSRWSPDVIFPNGLTYGLTYTYHNSKFLLIEDEVSMNRLFFRKFFLTEDEFQMYICHFFKLLMSPNVGMIFFKWLLMKSRWIDVIFSNFADSRWSPDIKKSFSLNCRWLKIKSWHIHIIFSNWHWLKMKSRWVDVISFKLPPTQDKVEIYRCNFFELPLTQDEV